MASDMLLDFQYQLTLATNLYDDNKLLQASRVLYSLQDKLTALLNDCTSDAITRQAALDAKARLAVSPFPNILSDLAEVQALRDKLNSSDGWILSYDGPETKVWYRPEATSSHSILIEGTIRAPLINVTALIQEADLYPSLFWYVTNAKQLPLCRPSRLRRAVHITAHALWPLYDRDVAIHGFAVDALDDLGCVLVMSRSIRDTDSVAVDVPPPASRVVRVDMNASGFELVPISPDVTKARFLYNGDPHLAFLPMALINWAARTMCRWSLKTLESRAKDLNKVSPIYMERLSSEPVYEYIRERLTQYWASKHTKPPIDHPDDSSEKLPSEIVGSQRTLIAAQSRHSSTSHRSDSFDADISPRPPPLAVIRNLFHAEKDPAKSSRIRHLSKSLLGKAPT